MKKPLDGFDTQIFFQALADPTRLRIINLLGDEEVCVCDLATVMNTHQPGVSRHLSYLRRAGLVSARRAGTWMHYRLTEPTNLHAKTILVSLRAWLAQDAVMREEHARLVAFRSATEAALCPDAVPR
jgi:ArsR family transcriptional regulator, arsenate/arsenite/antimonite-responsive transcriptional repressor